MLSSRRWLSEITALLVASDPGLLRLRLGLRATLAVGAAALVLHWLAPALGVPGVVLMLLGGMIGLNGAFAASGRSRRDAALTISGVPVVAAVTVTTAALLAGHRLATLITFVVVMVVAAYLRRFGPRWFNYGMVGWLTYFFAAFIGFRLAQVGAVVATVALAAGCVLVATMLVPDRPAALLRASLRAFDLRLDTMLSHIADGVAGAVTPDDLRRRLHGATFRLIEAALIVDGHLAEQDAYVDAAPAVVRHNVFDAELAAEEIGRAALQLAAEQPVAGDVRVLLHALLSALRQDQYAEAVRLAASLDEWTDAEAETQPPAVVAALRTMTAAVPALVDGLRQRPVEIPAHVRDYHPAVTLFLGNLPGAMSSVGAVISGGDSRWTRLSQNTRLCIQVAVATSLTIAAGDLLSARRYYWAVLACFLALTGTFTTGEIIVKGSSRVVGTMAGLVAATVAVHFTGAHTGRIVGVMLACVFVGLYFFRVSYAVMAFAVTTVMGELYNVLHEFSADLLLLRLAETALGAFIGIATALVLLPLRTADVLGAARSGFLAAACDLLTDAERRLAGGEPSADLFLAARRVDAALHQLALVARPAGGATLLGLRSRRAMQQLGRYSHVAFLARASAAAVAAATIGANRHAWSARAEALTADLRRALGELRPQLPSPDAAHV